MGVSEIKKASLAEIFTANTGLICAGIAALKGANTSMPEVGGYAAKLGFDVKEKLLREAITKEQAASEMLSFFREASQYLQDHAHVRLLSKIMQTGKHNELGSVADLLEHITDIMEREELGEERVTSAFTNGRFKRYPVAYLEKGGKFSKKKAAELKSEAAAIPAPVA